MSTSAPAQPEILKKLNTAASAEEFFQLLGVDYDIKVVNVARLHILRRMGQYLVSEDFSAMSEEAVTARCKDVLAKAYADFVASSPIDERVFKVLKDAVKPKPQQPMVHLTTLK